VITAAMPNVEKCIGVLAGFRGDSGFLVGGELTLADLYLMPIYDYFQNTPESKAVLAKHPGLTAWWQQVGGRPSVAATKPALG